MNVLLLGPWARECGIAEYARQLVEAVGLADHRITLVPARTLSSDFTESDFNLRRFPIVHLNHSQGTERSADLRAISRAQALGIPCVITQHDTFETAAIMRDRGFLDFSQATALVVHEPIAGLSEHATVYTWRQGIPAPQRGTPMVLVGGDTRLPVLGTTGFPSPWKQYDLLAEGTRAAGWGLYLAAAGATDAQVARWQAINPQTFVDPTFLPGPLVVSRLTGCTATAFLYACANSGTSGALRCGIAARRPVFVTACRQFRDLLEDPEWASALTVIPGTVEGLAEALTQYTEATIPTVKALAAWDAWTVLGEKYAWLYRQLAGGVR